LLWLLIFVMAINIWLFNILSYCNYLPEICINTPTNQTIYQK
jgi:hypothetical protein